MTGSIFRIIGGVLAVLVAIVVLPGMCQQRLVSEGRDYDEQHYVKPNEALIRAAVMELLSKELDRACVKTASIPFDSASRASHCERCETLADAGLLQRSMGTTTVNGQPRPSIRFELSDRGRLLYRQNLGDREAAPGFCFGKTVVDELDFLVVRPGYGTEVHVRVESHVADADALLFTAHAKALGLPHFKRLAFKRSQLPPLHLVAKLDGKGVYQSIHWYYP